jgi:hypothetical protein
VPGRRRGAFLCGPAGWERQERLALLLLVLVTAAVLAGYLIFGTVGKAPFARPFSNASREGELVSYGGVVERVTHTREGGHLILDVQGVQVFIPATAAQGYTIVKGDAVSLYGMVQTYRGEREIVVQDRGDITIHDDAVPGNENSSASKENSGLELLGGQVSG